jgi:hypothetical protein
MMTDQPPNPAAVMDTLQESLSQVPNPNSESSIRVFADSETQS